MLWVVEGTEVRTLAGFLVKKCETTEKAGEYRALLEAALIREVAAKEPYGAVEYADPGYQRDGQKRYPIDTAEHCRAAWSFINHPHNEAVYTPQQVTEIKGKIRSAAKKLGVDIAG